MPKKVPVSRSASENLVGEIHCQTESIQIRSNPGQANPQTFPPVFRCGFRNRPTSKKMSNRAHRPGKSEFRASIGGMISTPGALIILCSSFPSVEVMRDFNAKGVDHTMFRVSLSVR